MPAEAFSIMMRLPVFALVAGRLGGMLMFQPLLGALSIPIRVRAMLVISLAILCTPLIPVSGELPTTFGGLALAVAGELLLGILMGLAMRMIFTGLELSGLLISQQAGLAFGRIADPNTGVDSVLLSSFYVQLGSVIFLIIGGHRIALSVVLDTFQDIPLLSATVAMQAGVPLLFEALVLGADLAVRVAAPVLLTLFLVNIALGFVGRTVPQLNILTVGFPIKGILALLLLAVTLPAAMELFTESLETVISWTAETMRGAVSHG